MRRSNALSSRDRPASPYPRADAWRMGRPRRARTRGSGCARVRVRSRVSRMYARVHSVARHEGAGMTVDSSTRATDIEAIRHAVRELCARFPVTYWRDLDRRSEYPEEFVRAMTEAGWLSVLIPEEYGGAGLGISEASV